MIIIIVKLSTSAQYLYCIRSNSHGIGWHLSFYLCVHLCSSIAVVAVVLSELPTGMQCNFFTLK